MLEILKKFQEVSCGEEGRRGIQGRLVVEDKSFSFQLGSIESAGLYQMITEGWGFIEGISAVSKTLEVKLIEI